MRFPPVKFVAVSPEGIVLEVTLSRSKLQSQKI